MVKVGNVKITAVVEAGLGGVIQELIPKATPEAIKEIAWLYPHHADENGQLKAQVQTFLVEAGDQKIVIDPGVGNGRRRPEFPTLTNLQTSFIVRLSQTFKPGDVDFVICTHLHCDHVGWNTTLVDGKWMPTFPNAEYIFCEDEFNYWNSRPTKELPDDRAGFDESVLPVCDAGLSRLVPSNHKLLKEISLIPTPGHTPGHVGVIIESAGQRAVIVGDAVHHPCQIAHPDWSTVDTNSERANLTRRQLLEQFADTGTLLIGAHFARPEASRLERDGLGFKLT